MIKLRCTSRVTSIHEYIRCFPAPPWLRALHAEGGEQILSCCNHTCTNPQQWTIRKANMAAQPPTEALKELKGNWGVQEIPR